MDQIKIGKFIQEMRKEKKITQEGLAEMLGITDRAVSKWERGLCIPDAGTMPELCKILNITINDLFSGEKVDMKDNEKKLEENLMDMIKLKEQRDKELLTLEIFIGLIGSIIMATCIVVAALANMEDYLRVILIIVGITPFGFTTFYALRIEQIAGYYECKTCHHKYVPTYKRIVFSMHINRTRKMKCPNCNKKTWHKKVITK